MVNESQWAADTEALIVALENSGIGDGMYTHWRDMLGESVRVGHQAYMYTPEFNVNGPDPRVWVVTLHMQADNDGAAYAEVPAEVPQDLRPYSQIDVPDSPDALPTIVKIIKQVLGVN